MSSTFQDCTHCKRCESVCPETSPISDIMQLFQDLDKGRDREEVLALFDKEYRRRTGCVNCARCLPYCPEKINIPYYILSAKEDFE